MNMTVLWGVLLGGGLGLGMWAIVSSLPSLSKQSLASQLAPYVADISEEAFVEATSRRAHPLPMHLVRFTQGSATGRQQIQLRLRQATSALTVEDFLARRLVWAGLGLVGGLLLVAALLTSGTAPSWTLAVILILSTLTGYVAAGYLLQRQARQRISRIESELPTVWEFLSLSLTAGESMLDAIRRLATIGTGEMAEEFSRVIRSVDAGDSLSTALEALRDRLQIIALTRGLEQVLNGLHRGTPLASVLQAQAQDAREDAKRELIERAGQKEVAMLVPLVFLILPVTIIFAVFPGLLVIQSGL